MTNELSRIRLYFDEADLGSFSHGDMARVLGGKIIEKGRTSQTGPFYMDIEPDENYGMINFEALSHFPVKYISGCYPLE